VSNLDVCVVIPHFNRAELLRETLDSVLQQTSSNWHVIVVDDGSDLTHWERIRQYAEPRIRIIRREDGSKGPSRCRNLGWQAAQADLVLFLDSDDLLGGWCLQQRLAAVDASQHADAWVFPVMLFKNRPGDLPVLWNRMQAGGNLERFLVSDPPWHTSSTLWRRSTLQMLGGFNEQVMYGDDADLHIRALLQEVRFSQQPDALPDVFIRRADQQRITGTSSPQLLESRVVRLRAGTQMLNEVSHSRRYQQLWQGQYFRECEFLLFNVPDSQSRIRGVLRAWQADWPGFSIMRAIAACYLWLACLCSRRAYLLLRIGRRISMCLLPAGFFPRGGGFEQTQPAAAILSTLQRRLGKADEPHVDPGS
jgi:glycosyltransferase involved in cell wall biosynthesis